MENNAADPVKYNDSVQYALCSDYTVHVMNNAVLGVVVYFPPFRNNQIA